MKYRPEIDGLRALAVIPVILFHAEFSLFMGGFIGVDIFFVISGYLITSIIIADLEAHKFSILNFYERRARRILPALFLVIFFCLPFAWHWMLAEQFRDFSQSLVGVSAFASNILFHFESGYFAPSAELKPLLHTWSLAVEEQYYVIFPLLLIAIWKYGINKVFLVVGILALLSLMIAEFDWRKDGQSSFYLPHARAWELLAGSISAFVIHKQGVKSNELLASLGLLMIAGSLFMIDENIPFPSIYTLIPVVGVMLLILFAGEKTRINQVLSANILVGVGLISYSAYLWHQPLFAFVRLRSLEHPSSLLMGLLVLCTFLLAYLTWKYIEGPFRDKEKVTRRQLLKFSVGGLVFFSVIGLLGHFGVSSSNIAHNQEVIDDWRDLSPCVVIKGFRPSLLEQRKTLLSECFGQNENFILIGDSHGEALSKSLRMVIDEKNGGLISLLHNGCLPIVGTSRVPLQINCIKNKKDYWDSALSTNATIIVAARWRLNLVGTRFDNTEGGVEYGDSSLNILLNSKEKHDIYEYTKLFLRTAAHKNRLILIDQIPEAGWHVPERIAKIKSFREPEGVDISTSYEVFLDQNKPIRALFAELETVPNISIIHPSQLVCNIENSNRCVNSTDSQSLYIDDNHPSPRFAEKISKEISNLIPKE
ncbi:acyltransferase [Glaciecola sp. MH2013]|uniref:acyltransferase family protein n=1 Tax=Glaciecola sp. MH2013 TaxID=2785524 RepID=UPI00189F1D65|nr:acyltransferase family protein [Glaciecola sp. MH2013]MBF7072251.1 acyltransferase [Glaciecola sp. MH2013]